MPRMAIRHFNKSGSFDGIDDTVNCGDDNSLDFLNALTLEGWVCPTSYGGGNKGRMIDRSSSSHGYLFYLENSAISAGLRLTLDNINYTSDANIIELNKWQHIAVTFDKDLASDQIKFYVNGILKSTATKTTAIHTAGAAVFRMGYGRMPGRLYAGKMDEVRAYERGLTEAEVKQRYFDNKMITDGLVSYWDFNDDMTDQVGSNDGAVTGMAYSSDVAFAPRVAASNRIVTRNFTHALDFDGVDDKMDAISMDGFPAVMTDITIAVWTKPIETANDNFIVAVADDGANRINFSFHVGGIMYWDFGDINNGGRLCKTFKEEWIKEFALWTFTVKNGVGMKIYRNNFLIVSNATTSTFTRGAKTLQIANGSSGWWKGLLSKLLIFDRVITAQEREDYFYDNIIPITPVLNLPFTEGVGNTVADSSGNNNDGTITGAEWSEMTPFKPRVAI